MNNLTPEEKRLRTRQRRKKAKAKGMRIGTRKNEVVEKVDWTALRPEILKKSDGCYLCGAPLTPETMTSDHVTIGKMGQRKNDATDNLMPCCWYCNHAKGSRRLIKGACGCGQKFLVRGLGCLRCWRLGLNFETTVTRHSEVEI